MTVEQSESKCLWFCIDKDKKIEKVFMRWSSAIAYARSKK